MSGKTQPIKMRKKDPMIGRILECLLLAFLFVLFVLPFYYMIISSFKSTIEAMSNPPVWWPSKFIWTNFADAWNEAHFTKYGLNSIILAAAVVVTCLVCSVPCAFAFARMEFKGKKPLFAIILSDMMVPVQCVFLPLFIIFSKLGWLNTYGSMILLFTYSGSTIFFIRNSFMQVNNEVLEAARLDGDVQGDLPHGQARGGHHGADGLPAPLERLLLEPVPDHQRLCAHPALRHSGPERRHRWRPAPVGGHHGRCHHADGAHADRVYLRQ